MKKAIEKFEERKLTETITDGNNTFFSLINKMIRFKIEKTIFISSLKIKRFNLGRIKKFMT